MAVLRIHDILVRIRIRVRICGSVPLTKVFRSGSGSCYFHQLPSRLQKKSFPYYFLKLCLHHFSKIKSDKEVTKQQESRFLKLSLLDRRIRIWIRTSYQLFRIREVQKHTDPTDPDPQQWFPGIYTVAMAVRTSFQRSVHYIYMFTVDGTESSH